VSAFHFVVINAMLRVLINPIVLNSTIRITTYRCYISVATLMKGTPLKIPISCRALESKFVSIMKE